MHFTGWKKCLMPGCDHYGLILTKNHLKTKHGITKEEYLKMFPEQTDAVYWGTCAYATSARYREQHRKELNRKQRNKYRNKRGGE